MPNIRSLSVQSKLIAAFVVLTLVAMGVVSWIGYVNTREGLRVLSERNLMGLQRSRAALVGTILRSARNEVLTLSGSRVATDAARELRAAYRDLARETVTPEMQAEVRRFYREEFGPALAKRLALAPPEDSLLPTTSTGWYLHYHYIATGPKPYGDKHVNLSSTDKSAYGQAVARLLPELKADIDRLEQQNLLFVDPETLDVFFSLEQSSILGTNLLNGPVRIEQLVRTGAEAAQLAERRRLQGRGLRSVSSGAREPEGVRRHTHLRWSAHECDHDSAPADRADHKGSVRQRAMGGGRPRARPGKSIFSVPMRRCAPIRDS